MILYLTEGHLTGQIKEDETMREYNIYNMQTDEYIGTVKANSINDAEYKASGIFTELGSDELYALTKED